MWIPLVIAALIPLILIGMYNGLVSIRNQCDEAWSNIDTELKRRYELIPNLVNTVKGFAKHERELLQEVTAMREKASSNDGSIASQAADESALQGVLSKLMVRLEAYPEVKASPNFLELQSELSNTENRIQAALRFYNGNIRANNNKVQQFPSNIIAGMFGFQLREFFELDIPEARIVPKVEF
ncbi:MAG: LemA family protein [Planctomycetes bacterium]|jgi:LemA protein|nr:LemA family protein [Planctomycetota bacterium]MBT4029161.1 LemA family protein [Planctomycetota bacterium]MBT4559242.1 LemA family protein [Planctomycetota bacterium]MBT5101240.1 LemA family protein [Planctomycetota bacterium]MBT7012542.1 LemA family protein [Planctomycetota bacterium]